MAEEVDHKVVLPLQALEMMEDQVEEERMYLSVQLLEMEMFLPLVLLKEILVVNILLLEEIGEQVQVVAGKRQRQDMYAVSRSQIL